jgi:hypothetical protein
VDYGVHLPLISLKGQRHWSLRGLLEYTEIAERLGFRAISANDHLIFPRPWLDGPTALAAVLARTGQMALATTVALPIVRGPVALAKSLAAPSISSPVVASSSGWAWLFCPGLRRGRHPLRGALEASRGGSVGDARFVAQGGFALAPVIVIESYSL